MEAFTTHTGLIGILDRANVDTDQIIPKQFMKKIGRTGFGEHAFNDWRYLPGGKPNPDFELNAPRYKGASVLITGNNFGCGSSREHAVWAIQQAGFRAIIAPVEQRGGTTVPGFADIFRNNCGKNGVLTIELSPAEVSEIIQAVRKSEGAQARIDLQEQVIALQFGDKKHYRFDVDPATKTQLLQGLDEIALSLSHESAITAFEREHDAQWYE